MVLSAGSHTFNGSGTYAGSSLTGVVSADGQSMYVTGIGTFTYDSVTGAYVRDPGFFIKPTSQTNYEARYGGQNFSGTIT